MKPLVSDTAMVMAAGLGTRMRPLTDAQPKPMVPVAGKPLIDHALDRLAEAGIARAVVNVHHFAEAVEAHIGRRSLPRVTISDERALLLETGGGMVKAQDLLPDPFFCVNSDNVWVDGPKNAFRELSDAWDPARMDALLLLVAHPGARNFIGKGDFHMDGRGRLTRRRSGRIAPFVFTGIQLVSKRLLRNAPDGPFSTNLLWDRAIEEMRLFGAAFTGQWFEVGNPAAIAPTEAALAGARGNLPRARCGGVSEDASSRATHDKRTPSLLDCRPPRIRRRARGGPGAALFRARARPGPVDPAASEQARGAHPDRGLHPALGHGVADAADGGDWRSRSRRDARSFARSARRGRGYPAGGRPDLSLAARCRPGR
jgi:MurNAc alpha-1-phosphate uridylyltransferase